MNHIIVRFVVILFIIFSFLNPSKLKAKTVIYSEDFEDYSDNSLFDFWELRRNIQWSNFSLPCMNGSSSAIWRIENIFESNRVGITVGSPSCTTEISPVGFTIPDLSNYKYEVDISLPGSVIKDRSVLFRYNAGNQAYGFTIKDYHNIKFYKVNFGGYDNQFGSAYYETGFIADQTYHIEVITINNLITVKINGQIVKTILDQQPILSTGTIALQASTGSYGINTVWFDNIKVTDLSIPTPTPTPTPTPLPYFNQTDYQDNLDNINRTISAVGCNLTSTAMILASHGLNKVPWGNQLVDLSPKSLNDWLNLGDHKKWFRGGNLNPSAITELSKALNASDSAQFTKLEFKRFSTENLDDIDDVLHDHPLIFKLEAEESPTKIHFIVADKSLATDSGHLYAIRDPFDESKQVVYSPVEKILRADYYYPTESDFSYLWLNFDATLNPTIFNSNLQSTSEIENSIPNSDFSIENPIFNHQLNSDEIHSPFKQISLKYPVPDTYLLEIETDTTGFHNLEVFAYSPGLDSISLDSAEWFDTSYKNRYRVNYSPETEPFFSFIKIADFASLHNLIGSMENNNLISGKQLSTHLHKYVDTMETVYPHSRHAALMLLQNIQTKIKNEYLRNTIDITAFNLLNTEIALIRQQLF